MPIEIAAAQEAGTGCAAIPVPREGERPTVYADRVGEWCAARKSERYRKKHGFFPTPVAVADFMAGRIEASGQALRVLDPAAGAGVLCCAAVEALASRSPKPERIDIVAYEIDGDSIASLQAVLRRLADWGRGRGIALTFRIEAVGFILAHSGALRARCGSLPFRTDIEEFDIVIANPPWFKIGKTDPRAVAASDAVHGQPNIYALFMAVGAALLRVGGDFIYITPRSFASGPYFRRFRTVFFDMIRPTGVHIFDSRRDAFARDAVIQENVILSGVRRDRRRGNGSDAPLAISSSRGAADIGEAVRRELPAGLVLDLESGNRVLRVPVCDEEEDALALVDSWPGGLHSLGLSVSTGPVVAFRAKEHICRHGAAPGSHAPLLWMDHVRAMRASWPLEGRKPEYIRRSSAGALLAPNRNYVLLRRFSAREEARRLTAAPWLAARRAGPDVGIENHLNYIHRPDGALSEDEAWGLSAPYNSRLLDTWFRAVNGNTQVNATELRAMPLPPHGTIITLGRRVKRLADPMDGLDALVAGLVAHRRPKEAAVGEG